MIRKAKPLIKWAGGKGRLVPEILPAIRATLEETGGRYFEPFLGGGAIALALGWREMILNDAIRELADFYRQVKDRPAELAYMLSAIACKGVDEKAYYEIRDSRPNALLERAARFLYLNRLGFNGIYRVNKAGEFNVPYAKDPRRKSMIERSERDAITSLFPNKEKIIRAGESLAGAQIYSGDFARVMRLAASGDVVYCDPPYDGTYDSYTAGGFSEDDQRRLAAQCRMALARGAHVMISNSDTELIRYLYSGATIVATKESRTINSDTKGRQKVPCVLVVMEPCN